jgi:hypothetical protein
VDECIDEYLELCKTVFEVDQVFQGIIPVGDDQCRFDYRKLEKAIKNIVNKKLEDENAIMADSADSIPTFVVAIKGLHTDGPPTLFRSYQCQGHNVSNCAIWEAGRATSAAPIFHNQEGPSLTGDLPIIIRLSSLCRKQRKSGLLPKRSGSSAWVPDD